VDEDTEMDLQFLQLRNYTDPKKFMKKSDGELPKHFEVGHLVAQSADFFSDGRSKGKMKSQHFVDVLLEDQAYKKYAKRKAAEIHDKQDNRNKKAKRTQS